MKEQQRDFLLLFDAFWKLILLWTHSAVGADIFGSDFMISPAANEWTGKANSVEL